MSKTIYSKTLAGILVGLTIGLPALAQADEENYREISHALGQIGKILEEKRQADREGREVQLDTQQIYDNFSDYNRQQHERASQRPSPRNDDYTRYGRTGSGGSVNDRREEPGSRYQQGQSSRYGYLNPTPAQRTRHQRLLDAIDSSNRSLDGRGNAAPTPATEPRSYQYPTPTRQSNAQPSAANSGNAGYSTPTQPPSNGSYRPSAPQQDAYPPQGRTPRCVKWGKPTADHGGGVFGTGAAQKCLKTEF